MYDKEFIFWNKFYKSFKVIKPSSFAIFVLKKLKRSDEILLDVGCGNGRDTFFFIRNKIKSIGLDISRQAINSNNRKNIGKNFFIYKNFCKPLKNKIQKNLFGYVYARFFIHAINLKEEKIFFANCKKFLKKDGKIFLEFRTIKDSFFKLGTKISKYEYFTDHYRRFIDIKMLKKRLKNYGFKIEYKKIGKNLAKYKKENPHVCRLILVHVKI